MNSAETIQAAIDKLTRLRQMSDEETFKLVGEGPALYLGYWYVASSADPSSITPEDADLIVTLHATIEAQLAILRSAADQFKDSDRLSFHDEPNASQLALTLASAILGEQADD